MAAQGIEDGAQSFAFGVGRPGGSGGMLPEENFEILISGIPEHLYVYTVAVKTLGCQSHTYLNT